MRLYPSSLRLAPASKSWRRPPPWQLLDAIAEALEQAGFTDDEALAVRVDPSNAHAERSVTVTLRPTT